MTDAEKLTALADEIAAGFTREPWRDQRGMGYVEVQMDRADEEEYREMAAHIAQLEAERDALAAALVKARDLAGTASCYEVDAALSTEAGSDVFGSPGIARKSLVKRAKNAWAEFDAIIDGDPAAILAARDARMKREGAIEALRGLPMNKPRPSHADYPDDSVWRNRCWFDDGWNAYSRVVGAAIAALEQEAKG